MGLQEKEREEGYWKTLSENGAMPELPMEFASPDKREYVRSILLAPYNQLTKVLFGEVLARSDNLQDDESAAVAEAAEWMPRLIFSKKRDFPLKAKMGDAFAAFRRNAACQALKGAQQIDDGYQATWQWIKKASDIYKRLPGSASEIKGLVDNLRSIAKAGAWDKVRADEKLRSSVLFWLVKLMSKGGDGVGVGALTFLRIFKFYGLENLPSSCFERKTIVPKPEKGRDYYPSIAEEVAKFLYKTFKDLQKANPSKVRLDEIKWATDFISQVFEHFTDDEWGSYRIGKMLIWSGDAKAAKDKILPVVMRKQTEFWVWDLLGELFPEKRKACVARACLCKADEKYTGPLHREAVELGLDLNDAPSLKTFASDADEILLEGMIPVKGILTGNYKNKEGKFRVRFKSLDNIDPMPVSPAAIRLPRGLENGTPVWLYRDEADPQRLVAVRLREEASLWDLLPSDNATFFGTSKNGNFKFASDTHEYSIPKDAPFLPKEIEVGDYFELRYQTRKKGTLEIRDICFARKLDAPSPHVSYFEGNVRFLPGDNSAAFVRDVYLPPPLVASIRKKNCQEGQVLCGKAIRLPPRPDDGSSLAKRPKVRINALTVEIMSGEALSRYRSENDNN